MGLNYTAGTKAYLGKDQIQTILNTDEVYFNTFTVFEGTPIVRFDANASSVSIAIPGTKFGTTFGQNSYRSDISSYVSLTGNSLADPPITGSPAYPSSSYYWTGSNDGYDTSIAKGEGAVSNFVVPSATTNVHFGTGAFTIETYFKPISGTGDVVLFFHYNNGSGFALWSSAGYYRWVGQNGTANEGVDDYSPPGGTLANGDWHHFFISRNGSNWYGGVDGVIRSSFTFTNSGNATGTTAAFSGMGWPGSTGQRAVLYQDFRVTKGAARYTGAEGTSYTLPPSIVTLG